MSTLTGVLLAPSRVMMGAAGTAVLCEEWGRKVESGPSPRSRLGRQQPGDLRGCPAVAPCRGPRATRSQLLGDGCQRRLTRPLDLGNNRSRRWQLGGSLIYSGFLAFNFLGSFPQRRSYDIVVEGLLCRSKNAGPDRSRFFSGGECERSARSPAAFRAVKMWALPLEQHSRHFAPVIDPLGEGYWERI